MGRFSAILFLALVACGDNLDGGGPEVAPDGVGVDQVGGGSPVPYFVPAVCGVQSWNTTIAGDPAMNVSVAARGDGAAVLAAPTKGGSLTGFVLDSRMDMVSTNKIEIDGVFTQVVATYSKDRVLATAVGEDAVLVHLLDNDLANPLFTAKLPGTFVADPAFFNAQADVVMPIAGDDGLWLHRFNSSFQAIDSKLVMATKPASAMTAAQMGTALVTAFSTVDDCNLMVTSHFAAGPTMTVPTPCADPRIAVNQVTSEAIMVFAAPDGLRMMDIHQLQFLDNRLIRGGATSPRAVFDGKRFWVSYLDVRGDVIVGFIGADKQLVTMSLGGPQPEQQAYELVVVGGEPWVFSLGTEGYSAYRMCVEELSI